VEYPKGKGVNTTITTPKYTIFSLQNNILLFL
jgi:hypothetical protein